MISLSDFQSRFLSPWQMPLLRALTSESIMIFRAFIWLKRSFFIFISTTIATLCIPAQFFALFLLPSALTLSLTSPELHFLWMTKPSRIIDPISEITLCDSVAGECDSFLIPISSTAPSYPFRQCCTVMLLSCYDGALLEMSMTSSQGEITNKFTSSVQRFINFIVKLEMSLIFIKKIYKITITLSFIWDSRKINKHKKVYDFFYDFWNFRGS